MSATRVCVFGVLISWNILCTTGDGTVEWKNVSLGGERCGEGDSKGQGTWVSSFPCLFCNHLLFSGHERHSLSLSCVHMCFSTVLEGTPPQLLVHFHDAFCFRPVPYKSLSVVEVKSLFWPEYFPSVLRTTEFKG